MIKTMPSTWDVKRFSKIKIFKECMVRGMELLGGKGMVLFLSFPCTEASGNGLVDGSVGTS